MFDAAGELDLASNPLPSGPVGFVSQSGNIALETGLLLADVGLGFSRLASIGNQADLDVTDVLRDLAAHDGTRAIGVYCEDFRDGRAFAEAARTAGKPVVLLTVGQHRGVDARGALAHRCAHELARRGRCGVPRGRRPPRRHAAAAASRRCRRCSPRSGRAGGASP